MTKKLFVSLVIVAAVGLAASLHLTASHYRIAQSGFLEKSFCNVSELMDCDTVLASEYARLGPFLNSELGIVYYAFVLIVLFITRSRSASDHPKPDTPLGFLFLSSIFALFYTAYLAYLSFYEIQALCLFCLVTYGVNILLFVLIWVSLGVGRGVVPFLIRYLRNSLGRGEDQTPALRYLAALAAATGLSFFFFQGLSPEAHQTQPKISREAYLSHYRALPQKELVIPEDRPFRGDVASPVTLVEFSDFQCPYCRRAAFSLKPYLGEFRNRVRLVYLNYPLDPSCNPKVKQGLHAHACLAARAGLCAHQAGKFWEYHDRVFKEQKELSPKLIDRVIQDLQMDPESFQSCLGSEAITQEIAEDLELGETMGVTGTPALFINGRAFRDWTQPEKLRMVIEAELERAP